jgi:hypothetical protein
MLAKNHSETLEPRGTVRPSSERLRVGGDERVRSALSSNEAAACAPSSDTQASKL